MYRGGDSFLFFETMITKKLWELYHNLQKISSTISKQVHWRASPTHKGAQPTTSLYLQMAEEQKVSSLWWIVVHMRYDDIVTIRLTLLDSINRFNLPMSRRQLGKVVHQGRLLPLLKVSKVLKLVILYAVIHYGQKINISS